MNTLGMQILRTFAAVAALLAGATASAQPAMYGGSPFQNEFYNIDVDTAQTLSTLPVTGTSTAVTGINGVAVDPGTGTMYAILKLTAVTGRVLVTIEPTTGIATQIGNLGDNFASIAFRGDGQLFGVTGDGATVPETLYLIDKATAAKSVAATLGNGADGEVIAYNPDDGFFYHWSGNGTVVFERVSSTAPYTVTDIPLIGTANGEVFGAAWDACRNLFVASNIGSRLQTYAPDGTVGAQYGAVLLDDVRGMALLPPDNCNVDLAVTVVVNPAAPAPGSPVTLTFDIANLGPARALNPVVALAATANMTGATTSGCVQDPAGLPTCTLPATLFQGETAQVVVSATYTGGTGAVSASASSGSDETAPPNNTVTGVVGPVFTVTPTTGRVTTEAGGTDMFTVVLNAQPSADVTVAVSSSNPAEGSVSPTSLTFTPANWNVAQTVTLTGVDDAVADGTIAYTVVLGASSSADGGFDGIDPPDVAATNLDDDVAGVTIAPVAGLVTTEAGGTAQFTAVLTSQPTADVTIPVSSSDTTEGTTSTALLTFTPANWNVAQPVIVTGVDDLIADGNVAYTVIVGAAGGGDATYAGIDPADVAVTNADNEVPGITVAPTAGLVTTEAGGTAQFTVVLTSQPTADVTVPVSSSDTTEGTTSTALLTFTPANWNVAQTVIVSGVDDLADDGDVAYTIIVGAAGGGDATYAGIDPADVAATNTDNEAAGITVAPTVGLVTTEAGGTAQFTVVLMSQPSANVTIPVASSDPTEGTASTASLVFTPANWNIAQAVTVTGVNDAIVDGTVVYSITLGVAASADAAYAGIDAADVSVSNSDNDVAAASVTPTSALVTTENGGTATFTVVLAAAPTANVTIPVSTSDATEGTVSPASLTFTPANWNVPQQVTVTGVADNIDDGDTAYTIVLGPAVSADPAFAGLDPADVTLVNNGAAGPAFATRATIVPGPGPVALLLAALAMLLAGGIAARSRLD